MSYFYQLIQILLHIDVYLNHFIALYGFWTYLALFLVIFSETGLIILPFLPGDSLLFTAGSLAAQSEQVLNPLLLFIILVIASILGNQFNFFIGRIFGTKISQSKKNWLNHKNHLIKTHAFYEKYGGKTIIFARFIPIIRTFAPFVAGMANMNTLKFSSYNVFSALLWIGSLLSLGYFLGSQPFIKEHFTLVIYGIVAFSLLPPLISFINQTFLSKNKKMRSSS